MKRIMQITFFSTPILAMLLWMTGSIYSYSVPSAENGTQQLNAYEGKKMLIITLPVTNSPAADSMLQSLDTLAANRTATLKVIAVPSFEDGYTAAQQASLLQWYRSKLGNHILITEGLYTRKSSGMQQHGLFRWLTNVNENESFNIDVEGPGQKFFVSTTGRLTGVLRPQTKISSMAVQRTLGVE